MVLGQRGPIRSGSGAEAQRIIGATRDEMQVSLKPRNEVPEDLAKPDCFSWNGQTLQVFERINPLLSLVHTLGICSAQFFHKPSGLLCSLHVVLQTVRRRRSPFGGDGYGQPGARGLKSNQQIQVRFGQYPFWNHSSPQFR